MEQQKFSHITVGDEDDVVIVAGVPAQASASVQEQPSAAQCASSSQPGPASAPVSEPAVQAKEPAAAPAAAKPAKKADGYRETTLEDLESTKTGLGQKVIIVLAIVAVIVVAAYCILTH